MIIKNQLKNCIRENLSDKAGDIFLHRAFEAIDTAPDDQAGCTSSADQVKKLVMLFIDRKLSGEIYAKLKSEIDSCSWG